MPLPVPARLRQATSEVEAIMNSNKPNQDSQANKRSRPRRLRRSALLRELVAETALRAERLIQPHFCLPHEQGREEISSMPGA